MFVTADNKLDEESRRPLKKCDQQQRDL